MQFHQIHLGGGRSSLAGILPLSLAAGGRIHVVVHRGSRLEQNTELHCSVQDGGRIRDIPLTISSLSAAERVANLHELAQKPLADEQELLITTALSDEGLEAQAAFLVALARAREGKPTVVLLCHNGCGGEHPQLLVELRRLGVDVRSAVVSRLCKPGREAGGEARRTVLADAHVAWHIAGAPDGAALEALAATDGVAFTDDIEACALRARWLVLGPGLALALLAAEAGRPSLRPRGAESLLLDWLERVYGAFTPLVERRCSGLDGTAACASASIDAFMRFEVPTHICLQDLKRGNPLPFLRRFHQLVSEPCRDLRASGEALPSQLEGVFGALDAVLRSIESYPDHRDAYRTGDMKLYPEADARAVAFYRQTLGGVLDDGEIEDRAQRLTFWFDDHRRRLG